MTGFLSLFELISLKSIIEKCQKMSRGQTETLIIRQD